MRLAVALSLAGLGCGLHDVNNDGGGAINLALAGDHLVLPVLGVDVFMDAALTTIFVVGVEPAQIVEVAIADDLSLSAVRSIGLPGAEPRPTALAATEDHIFVADAEVGLSIIDR